MDKIVFAFIGFLIGAVLASAIFLQFYSQQNITGNVISTPSGNIDADNITVFEDKVVIKVPNATISNYEDTGSMAPLIDSSAHGIRIKPLSEDEINVGDLVSFNQSEKMIIHRVVQKGSDTQGVYFITRGDSAQFDDSPIRFSDIEYKTVGILY